MSSYIVFTAVNTYDVVLHHQLIYPFQIRYCTLVIRCFTAGVIRPQQLNCTATGSQFHGLHGLHYLFQLYRRGWRWWCVWQTCWSRGRWAWRWTSGCWGCFGREYGLVIVPTTGTAACQSELVGCVGEETYFPTTSHSVLTWHGPVTRRMEPTLKHSVGEVTCVSMDTPSVSPE